MPQSEQDPAHLSKSRLKSDLVAHNVALPPSRSRKEVYVGLHFKHIHHKKTAEFSSDEEDHVQDVADEDEDPDRTGILDPSCLTDEDLKATLLAHGVKTGPIVASTRVLYEKKLRTLLETDGRDCVNGAEKDEEFSDNEEEEEEEEDLGARKNWIHFGKGSKGAKKETIEQPDETQEELSLMERRGSISTSPNSDRELTEIRLKERRSKSDRVTLEPVKDILDDLFPVTQTTPTGIYATRRKPIKGAARQPVQYKYPDPPASPTTVERREVERHLVPLHIQIPVFLIVVVLLYLITVGVEDGSFNPLGALSDSVTQELEGGDNLLVQAETQGTPALTGQE